MEHKLNKKLSSFLKSLKNPKINNHFLKEKSEIKEKSDALRKLNVSSISNSKFEYVGKPGFKSTEVRFEWQTKKFKGDKIEGKIHNRGQPLKKEDYGKWEVLVNSDGPEVYKRQLKATSIEKFRASSLKNIFRTEVTENSFDDSINMTHQGIKTNYNRKLKSSACGSLSNLMNVTSSEADWNICNPRKYYKRMKDMSSDIFSNELPTFVRIKNIRIVDKESFKQSKDYAGNYRVEPPNHEFYDKINTKNKYGFMFRNDYDYKDCRHLNSTRSSIQFKRTNFTDTFNDAKYQYSENNSINAKPIFLSGAKYENRDTLKSKGVNNTKSSLSKSYIKNNSETSTVYSKGKSVSLVTSSHEGFYNKKKY